jgi:hypothetical protein
MPLLSTRREYFRLPYPVTSGAVLSVGSTNYKVNEISERGLRIVTDPGTLPLDSIIEGRLTLTAGLSCKIAGTVLRVEENTFVIKLDKGPTCYDVIREQRHLAKTHPEWKPQPL